jgi:hypothetical protein
MKKSQANPAVAKIKNLKSNKATVKFNNKNVLKFSKLGSNNPLKKKNWKKENLKIPKRRAFQAQIKRMLNVKA